MIASPKLSRTHPGRARECEDALKEEDFALLDRGRAVACEEFHALARRAQVAGWAAEEVAAAMHVLALAYLETAATRAQARRHAREQDNARPSSGRFFLAMLGFALRIRRLAT